MNIIPSDFIIKNLANVSKIKFYHISLLLGLLLSIFVFNGVAVTSYAYITIEDNEDNNGSGTPDDDMGKILRPFIGKRDSNHPIEFNINVTGSLPVSSAYLSLFIEDIDWPHEQNEVFLNGHSLGFAVGENDLNNSTLFVIPDLSWVKAGNNLVQVFVDQNHTGTWWEAIVQSGQLIFDDDSGFDTASIRTLASDLSEYDYAETVTIALEIDSTLTSQDVRIELLLRDPIGQLIDFDNNSAARNWTITENNDEPYQWVFTLPSSGNDGLWGVNVTVYDIAEQVFLDRRTLSFGVPIGAANIPIISSVTPEDCLAGEAKAVVITGSNFIDNNTNCTVGELNLDNTVVVDNTQITGNVSALLPVGTHSVVCNSDKGTGTLSNAFTVLGPDITAVSVKNTTSQLVTINNAGNTELIIGNTSITGTDGSLFTIQDDTCSGQTLSASDTCILEIIQTPHIIGSTSAYLEIISNDHDTPLLSIMIGGPAPVRGFAIQVKPGGVIRLTWNQPLGEIPAGYLMYRSLTAFDDPSQAERITAQPQTGLSYDDLPDTEDIYFYAAVSVDAVGNESVMSAVLSAVSDATPPLAADIAYIPTGNYDPDTGRMAPGVVNLVLTVSEPLMTAPYLSITPDGGSPLPVELQEISVVEYTGSFEITANTPTGTAYAVFSARDIVGNRGTAIQNGASIQIDTDGPAVTQLTLNPASPVKNDVNNPVAVTVTLGLNEEMKNGEVPQLECQIGARAPLAVTPLNQIAPQAGEAQAWQGVFQMPADAGQNEPESFHFVYSGKDDLDNISAVISGNNLFQVYQGDLPPLEPPADFQGQAEAGGNIRLSWSAVGEADGYQLYRQAPAESQLTEYQLMGAVLEFTDAGLPDGAYIYAVASIRQENGQEAVSAMSATATVNADSAAPAAPLNLAAELIGQGIRLLWQAPDGAETITYSVYRADTAEITSVDGLTPIQTGIDATQWTDPDPSPSEHCYAITAVDAAGNESPPSGSFYLNFDLLPVATLQVVQQDNDAPVISWTHTGSSIAGYNFYLDNVKLNANLLTGLSYTDTGYAGDERHYAVTAVDNNSVESLKREIVLPKIEAALNADEKLSRGIICRLEYTVKNLSSAAVNHFRVKADVEGKMHISEESELTAGASGTVSVVVGGYADLPDMAVLTTTLAITPNAGEEVQIIRTSQITVNDDLYVLGILNEEFIRGGTGRMRFTFENTGEEEIEIITALNSGADASDLIRWQLADTDGNVFAASPFKQSLGGDVIMTPGGQTVARISAGAIFTSAVTEIAIPDNAPDDVVLQLTIDNVHFRVSAPEQITINGLSTTQQISLMDTAYYGEVLNITPVTSTGDTAIVITGRAVERDSEQPLAEVPLNLVTAVDGFERIFNVFTDSDGNFTYSYTPAPDESGVYAVCAVHPDVAARPEQGQFTINRVTFNPSEIDLNIPRNYEQTLTIQAVAGPGTDIHNLQLIYAAADQPDGQLPQGIHVTPDAPVSELPAGELTALAFTIWADNTAAESGVVKLRVQSDENAYWGMITVNTYFTEALPALFFTPDHIETGVARDESITEYIELENKGLAALNAVNVALLNPDGTPAPEWLYLNADADQGDMAVGTKKEISITFAPPASVAEDVYHFLLRVTASNAPVTDINLYVAVTQSGIGNLLLKISDIFTGTIDPDSSQVIQGLAGAKVQVQNEKVLTIDETLVTDSFGEALFTDLPAGRYKCRITADNHQQYIGRLRVKPGITVSQEVLLPYDLVTVEWEVVETTIEDRYEIVLQATYETEVPAAVIVAEPSSLTIPDMQPGDVVTGEIRYTNYGLIRADDLNIGIPEDDEYFKYEILINDLPESLGAKEYIVVPYRITSLKRLPGQESGGGDCFTYVKCICIDYGFWCANGQWFGGGKECSCISYGFGDCDWQWHGTPGSGTWNPQGIEIEGVLCPPDPLKRLFDVCAGKSSTESAGSNVDLIRGQYKDYAVDLSVKIAGDNLKIQRSYYDNNWYFNDLVNRIKLIYGGSGAKPEYIEKDGVKYKPVNEDATVFAFDENNRIFVEDNGYRSTEDNGRWHRYDSNGRLIDYGNNNITIASMIYDGAGHLAGIEDNTGSQVLWYEYDNEDHIAAVYDADGKRVEYFYTDDKLTRVVDVSGAEWLYYYNSDNRLEKKEDSLGRATIITYNNSGYVANVTFADGTGKYFDYAYDEGKKEYYALVTYSSGREREVWFDRKGRLIREDINGKTVKQHIFEGRTVTLIDANGLETVREFDEWRNMTREILPDGSTVRFRYDAALKRKTMKIDSKGTITKYEYDSAGNLIKKTEAHLTDDERITEFTYDSKGNMLTITLKGGDNTIDAVTGMTYDDDGNRVSITDPEGNTTHFTYNAMGKKLTKEGALGNIWRYDYDAKGRLTAATSPLNDVTQFFYDSVGNKTKMIAPDSSVMIYEYDIHNKLVKTTDALGNTLNYVYNSDGQLVKKIDQEGKETNYEYNLDGQIVKQIDGAGNEIAYEYDNAPGSTCQTCPSGGSQDKPTKVILPTFSREYQYDLMGHVTDVKDVLDASNSLLTIYQYDVSGNMVAAADSSGHTTDYDYDRFNRQIKTTDPAGNELFVTYNNRNKRIEIKDKNGNATRFEYDLSDRMIKEIRPMGEQITYQYDGNGNLIQKTDAKNQIVQYEYDAVSRMSAIKYFSATDHSTPLKTVTFTYDAAGNFSGYDDGVTTAQYVYDDLHRKTAETINYGTFELTYSYSYYKNSMKKTLTMPDNTTYTFTYNNGDQLTSVNISDEGSITYSGYTWNKPSIMTLPGGVAKTYSYDALMRTQAITVKDASQNVLMDHNYSYDNTGNILTKQTEQGDYTYTYDSLSNLLASSAPADSETFTYDSADNRLIANGTAGTYNPNNELTGFNGVAFNYDNNGNMLNNSHNGDNYVHIYNVENRLVRVEQPDGSIIAEYYYDPFGRRLWKDIGGVKTYFLYTDEGLAGEFDENGLAIKTYGYKPASAWGGEPLFMKTNGNYYYYQNDHLGTPVKLTDRNGSVVWSADYSSFGEAEIDPSSSVINNLRFAGHYFDMETGYHYNFHRTYDAKLGRYLETDPLGISKRPDFFLFSKGPLCPTGNRLDDINLYSYALNNPVNYSDIYGLFSVSGGVDVCAPTGNPLINIWISVSVGIHECCDCKSVPPKPSWTFSVEGCFGLCTPGGSASATGSVSAPNDPKCCDESTGSSGKLTFSCDFPGGISCGADVSLWPSVDYNAGCSGSIPYLGSVSVGTSGAGVKTVDLWPPDRKPDDWKSGPKFQCKGGGCFSYSF